MIRSIIVFILLSISVSDLFSQTNKITISDSRVDSLFYTTADIPNNPYYEINGTPDGTWIVFYDSTFNKKLFEVTYVSSKVICYKTWYNNGLTKEYTDNLSGFNIGWDQNGMIRGIDYTSRDTSFYYKFNKYGTLIEHQKYLLIENDVKIIKETKKWNEKGELLE